MTPHLTAENRRIIREHVDRLAAMYHDEPLK
jgi:hypothetical protein